MQLNSHWLESKDNYIAIQECLAPLDKESVQYIYIEGDICNDAVFEDAFTVRNIQRICGAFCLATLYEEKPIKNLTMEDFKSSWNQK